MSNKKQHKEALDKAIHSVLTEMEGFTADQPEFEKMVEQLDKLYKIRASIAPSLVSPEAIVSIIANLSGIGMILGFERTHAMTTKALGFVSKPRV